MSQSRLDRLFALLALAVVSIAVITGFWWLGSPNRQRQIRADQQRLTDMHEIALRLHQKALQQKQNQPVLPASLTANDRKTDPISGDPYEYQRLDRTRYQLCAEFATDSARDQFAAPSPERDLWQHPSGRHCFELNALEEPPPLQNP